MEQHPIPQNISSFQFKLIGDITLKQFTYVAGGLILAYLATKITLVPSLLRWPIAGFFALLGFGLAFLPIEERPLDRWLASFIKSIYSPTQYVWKKSNPPPDILLTSTASTPTPTAPVTPPAPSLRTSPQTTREFISSVPPTATRPSLPPQPPLRKFVPTPPPTSTSTPTKTPLSRTRGADWWKQGAPGTLERLNVTKPITPPTAIDKQVVYQEKNDQPPPPKPADSQKIAKLTSQFQQKTTSLTDRIASLQKELAAGTIAKERLFELQELLGQLLTEKERMSGEMMRLRRQLEDKDKAPVEKPSTYTAADPFQKTTVKIVPPPALVRVGIPKLTTVPNVITGIIKDSSGNLLPNLIVTVKDKEGLPVRALKTNKLGQFAASTPLGSGIYVIEVDDPKSAFQFKRIEITLTGQVMPALEISAVSAKDLIRQKLAHEIFGKNTL